MRRLAALLTAVALAAPAGAHPHVWITGGLHFGLDAEGRLDRVHVTWIFDPFASLFLVGALGLDADGDQRLTAEEEARLVADQTSWPEEYDGDTHLRAEGEKRALGPPENATARFTDMGRLMLSFERPLAQPVRATAERPVTAKLYDPTYYFSYEVTQDPRVLAAPGHGCRTDRLAPRTAPDDLAALAQELSALDRTQTPAREGVGALFAETLVLRCG